MGGSRIDEAVAGVLAVPMHVALGVRLADPGDPAAGLEITVGEAATNNVGILHGGLVPGLLDVSCYLSALPHLGDGTNAVTVDVSASILRAVEVGSVVRFRGRPDRIGRSLAFFSAEARTGDELVATGRVTKAIVQTGS